MKCPKCQSEKTYKQIQQTQKTQKTKENPRTMIIVYHQIKPGIDCPDGICAAWIVAKASKNFELIGDSYLNNDEYEKEDYKVPFSPNKRDVVLVDFSYPKSNLESIANQANSLIVLDHHKSRMNDIESLSDRILGGYSPDDCGATFAWKYFFPDKPQPWFLKHVRRRDTGADGYYEGECPESEAINTAISSRRKGLEGEKAFQIFDELLKANEADLIAEGMPEIEKRNDLVQEALNHYNGALLKVGNYLVPYYQLANEEAHRHYSIIGSAAARLHKDAPFIAIATDNPLEISLRASKDSPVDLSKIAKSLGGGGHQKAAGYKIKK